MINSVSFGSTYKITKESNDDEQQKKGYETIADYCVKEDIPVKVDFKNLPKYPYTYKSTLTVVAPNRYDNEIETYCANKGIRYEKYNHDSMMTIPEVLSRVDEAPKGFYTVSLNVDKLNNILEKVKDEEQNITHCESDYYEYYKDKVDFMLKSGDKIPATTLYINSRSDKEDIINMMNRYGTINKGMIFVDFERKTDDPDHCIFFAMRDMGIKEIPVNVNKETLEYGQALGLFE